MDLKANGIFIFPKKNFDGHRRTCSKNVKNDLDRRSLNKWVQKKIKILIAFFDILISDPKLDTKGDCLTIPMQNASIVFIFN